MAAGVRLFVLRPRTDLGYAVVAFSRTSSEMPVAKRKRQAEFMNNARFLKPDRSSGRLYLLARGVLAAVAVAGIAFALAGFPPL